VNHFMWYKHFNVNSKSKKGNCQNAWYSYLILSASWGQSGKQVHKVWKSYVNGLWKYLRYYKNFNVNSESKKGALFCQKAWYSYLLLSTAWGYDGKQLCKVLKPYDNELENIWGFTKTLS
jgi:hypothetical protein